MSATHMGRGDMFHNAGTQNICKDSGTQILQTGPDAEATQDRQCRNYLEQGGYDPADQKANAERQGGQLFEPSCKWIYDNVEFQQWIDGADPPSLWLHGGPGKGKSMLLCSVINHLSGWAKVAPDDSGPSRLVTYSFFSDPDGVHEASFVVASLVYGLVKQQPSYFRRVSNVYDHENKYPFQGNRSFTALEKILEDMLRDTTGARVILVVDALDECKTDLDRLLDLILKTSSLQNVRWLVSSRGFRTICQEFDAAESNIRKLSLDQTGEDIQQAVQVYTHHQMWRLHHLRMSEEERETLERRLLRKAGGTFLWLSIVMAELKNVASWDIDDVVDGLPDDLESLYVKLLQNLVEDLGQKKSKNLVKDVLYRTLATTAAALRPLYIEELKELANFPAKIRDNRRVEELIDKCGAFLTCQNNQVFLIHLSAKEFLKPEKLQSAFQSDPLDIHSHLFSRSMFAMKENLKRDIYNLEKPGIGIDDIGLTPSPDPLCGLKYSCLHWVDHLAQVQEKSPWHYHAVRCFMEKCLLHWLEAMSLQRKFGEAVKAVRKLCSLMKNVKDHELPSLTEDARRFVLFQWHTIENYPLQTYVSALIFSPTGSWIRRLYREEEPDWISLKPEMETTWSACIQKLPARHVHGLAISTDGKLLASLFQPSTEPLEFDSQLPPGSVEIWDLEVHGLIRELNLDFEAHAVGFLSTGGRLALAGTQNRFEIWDAETGSRLKSLQGPEETSVCFTSLAVSAPTQCAQNRDLIASGSENGVISLRDSATGDYIRSIRTSGGVCCSLTFSPNGQKLVAGLQNGTVEVWDSRSGVLIWKWEDHDGEISSMAFLGDDQLVSSSFDGEALIWDLNTGWYVEALNGPEAVVSLGSNAGFASAAFEQPTVKIWNRKGDCIQVLEEHGQFGGSLAFSPEQQLLAFVADSSISIWDLKLDADTEPIPAHAGFVYSITFSSNGLLLATGSSDAIKIWETTNCTCICSIDGGGAELAFSPDNRYLVSLETKWGGVPESTDLTVWNVDCGELVKTFSNVKKREAFSPDGRLLALALDKPIVVIWDLNASKQRRQIQRSATCLVFSADGHKLFLASDMNLEIWDVASGERIWILEHQQSRVTSIALSADTRLLATVTNQESICVWDIGAAARRATLLSGQRRVEAVIFSLNQDLLAWANDHVVGMWNWKDDRRVHFLLEDLNQRFDGGPYNKTTLRFNHSNSSRLCTRIGDINTGNSYDNRVDFYDYHMHEDREWILSGNERMVLLPIEHRLWGTVNVLGGKTVAIGTHTGRILLFRFV